MNLENCFKNRSWNIRRYGIQGYWLDEASVRSTDKFDTCVLCTHVPLIAFFDEVYSFVLSHGSYLTCRSHWLILPAMQSIPLAVNSIIELIRTFSALMESERASSSNLRHVFYPETIAFKWTTSRIMLPLVSRSQNWPFFLWLYKTKSYVLMFRWPYILV
jgi:hypothetical protein